VERDVERNKLKHSNFACITLKQDKMQIEILTKNDLNQFKTELLEELKVMISKTKPAANQQKEWLKSYEVRKLLNISPGTLQTMRVNGIITFSKVGGIFYHSYADICKVLEGKK
jgi:hypothetical protein